MGREQLPLVFYWYYTPWVSGSPNQTFGKPDFLQLLWIALVVWSCSKQTRSPGAEQPTQVWAGPIVHGCWWPSQPAIDNKTISVITKSVYRDFQVCIYVEKVEASVLLPFSGQDSVKYLFTEKQNYEFCCCCCIFYFICITSLLHFPKQCHLSFGARTCNKINFNFFVLKNKEKLIKK